MNCIRENGVARGQIPNLRRPDVRRFRATQVGLTKSPDRAKHGRIEGESDSWQKARWLKTFIRRSAPAARGRQRDLHTKLPEAEQQAPEWPTATMLREWGL